MSSGTSFHWIPVLLLCAWIVFSLFTWLRSTRGTSVDEQFIARNRTRRFMRRFTTVPIWHKRALATVLEDAERSHTRAWEELDHGSRRLAIHLGRPAAGMREHFTIACIWFFEQPADLRAEWPALYDRMSAILGSDPAPRSAERGHVQAA